MGSLADEIMGNRCGRGSSQECPAQPSPAPALFSGWTSFGTTYTGFLWCFVVLRPGDAGLGLFVSHSTCYDCPWRDRRQLPVALSMTRNR